MKTKLTAEQKETMSYDDVAFLILNDAGKKLKIQDLFQKVIKALELPETEYTSGIGDFFELILTDKRFIMLEDGYCDLKINHSTKIVFDEEDDEDFELADESPEADEETDSEVSYDDGAVEDDDSDELDDLIVMNETEEDNEML